MLDDLIKEVADLAASDEISSLDAACAALIQRLPQEPGGISKDQAFKVLKPLRSNRRFEQLRRVANACLIDGCQDPGVTHFMSQGMIESGELLPAIGTLEHALQDTSIGIDAWVELKGALGRTWKDLAIQLRPSREEQSKAATRNAFTNYRDAWLKSKKDFTYQGINMVAVSHWDDGLALSENERAEADAAAEEIVEIVSSIPEDKRQNWDHATIGEACLGCGRYEAAVEWYDAYIKNENSAFALAGSARQLQQLWGADTTEWGQKLLAVLIGKLGHEPGGCFTVSPDALQRLAEVPKMRHEAVLGAVGSRTYDWLQDGIMAARSVAVILRNATPYGTGFVVRGADLCPSLGKELLVLTNAHVVSDPPEPDAASMQQATVQFELLKRDGHKVRHSVSEIVWQSPSTEHDVAVLRVDPAIPAGVEPLSLYHTLPALNDPAKERVFIIGHPGGREVSFSFEDNVLLDYDLAVYQEKESIAPCRIHYRTPTEPGSSGSPVFDTNWRIVGIHHAGGHYVSGLNGIRDIYQANEGLWIETVRRAMQKDGPFGEER